MTLALNQGNLRRGDWRLISEILIDTHSALLLTTVQYLSFCWLCEVCAFMYVCTGVHNLVS
jgi:hypothetical protein